MKNILNNQIVIWNGEIYENKNNIHKSCLDDFKKKSFFTLFVGKLRG